MTRAKRGRRWGLAAVAVLAAVVLPGSAGPSRTAGDGGFVGGWEQGAPTSWTFVEWGGVFDGTPPLASQFELVRAPVRCGRRAARFSVSPGDRYGTSSGERSLAAWIDSDESEGDVYYYAWSTLFPRGWRKPKGWAITLEWHSDARFPLAPLRFNVAGSDRMSLDMTTGECSRRYHCDYQHDHLVLRTLSKGRWNDFVLRVHWSVRNGSVELWHRVAGERAFHRVLDLPRVPTLPWRPGDPEPAKIYVLEGIYRGDDPRETTVVYQDCFRRVRSFAAAAAAWAGSGSS